MNILIVGANRGIGLELVKAYLKRGERVLAACRKANQELQNLRSDSLEIVEGIDVTQEQALDILAHEAEKFSPDMYLHVSGILRKTVLNPLDVEQIREQFEVNSLGPLRAVQAILPALKPGSKVGILTSRMGSIADNGSGGSYGYRMSKVAVNMAAVSLAHDLQPRGIAVALLHPGYVRTEMTGFNGLIDPDESAKGLVERMDALTLDSSGGFWHTNGELLPW